MVGPGSDTRDTSVTTPITIERMSLTMTEGTLVRWLRNEGDRVTEGESIAEIETDKVVQELDAPASGVLISTMTPSVSSFPVGTILGWIVEPGQTLSEGDSSLVGRQAEEQLLPHLRRVSQGNAVYESPGSDQPVISEGSDRKVRVSPAAKKRATELGVDVSQVAGSGPRGRVTVADVEGHLQASALLEDASRQVRVSPVAAQLAQESGLDLADIRGTGPGGRIMRQDVEQVIASQPPESVIGSISIVETWTLQGVRELTAQRMAASVHTTASVTLNTEVDATQLVRWREQIRSDWSKTRDLSVSYNDFLVMIAAQALLEHPHMNARLDGNTIVRLANINIGLAVDTEHGLFVPVIMNADRLGLDAVARETQRLVALARERRLDLDQLRDGTFTITNLGMFEIDYFNPIINLPEISILGVGRIREQPVGHGGQIMLCPTMSLSLTFDHRVVDGAQAARFLRTIKRYTEQPYLLAKQFSGSQMPGAG